MRMPRRVRIAGVTAGVLSLVCAASGVTYAATAANTAPPNSYAVACANVHRALRLLDGGACPRGDVSIKLAAAPTSLLLNSPGTGNGREKTVTVAGFSFRGLCTTPSEDGGTEANLDVSGPTAYDVQGSDIFTGDADASLNGQSAKGAEQVTVGKSARSTTAFELEMSGGVTGNLLIIEGGHTITVTFAIFAFSRNCSVQAQIAASS